jgi:hypothetical protein
VELLALTAPLYLVGGAPQDSAVIPGLLAQPAPGKAARGRERDYLFCHLTLSGAPEEAGPLADELVKGISTRFYQSSGSVTSALRRAVLDLNERLLRHNLSARRNHEGALTCAVLHGSELFTLQVGEALAFLGHNFGVERLPLQTGTPATPLGRSAGIDIRFAYHTLQIGDMLLLADPRLAYLNGGNLSPVLVDAEIEHAVDELIRVVGQDSARLLLVEFTDEMPATLPVSMIRKPSAAKGKPAAGPKREANKAAVATAAAVTAAGAADAPAPQREANQPPIRTAPGPTSTTGLSSAARAAAVASARGLSSATGWAANVVGLDSPEEEEDEQSPLSWAIPAFLAILIPLLVAAIVTGVYLQRGNVQRVGEIKQSMVEELVLAEGTTDEAEARLHYQKALALSAEGESLRPGDAEITRMRLDARESLDRLDGVSRLSAVVFDEIAGDVTVNNVALQGGTEGGVYMLDATNNRVFLRGTNETYDTKVEGDPQLVAFDGQVVGNQVIGPLVDMLWRSEGEAATREGLYMLDRTGLLFTHYPNLGDMRAVPLGYSSTWLNPVSMADYGGRLYVLDTGAQQIWKYLPQGEGYIQDENDKAIVFSTEADLDQATDFDLYSEDASLVIVYQDGRIRYFDTRSGRILWDDSSLLQNGLTSPLVAPAKVELVGRGLNASIFVLDPGSGRVVQIARGGTVLAQYRALDESGNELISEATDFAVLDSPLRIFITAGNKTYLATRDGSAN